MLTVLPIRYVADVAASRRFSTGLGLALRPDLSVDVWAHLSAGAGAVGIHDDGRRKEGGSPAPDATAPAHPHVEEVTRPHPVRGGGGAPHPVRGGGGATRPHP
ncbi:hypothetical protein [Streptomyces anulatus]|uniref:hypothetical protein n=1 Tax=Streptomyces anulatus TaxID=1892 RepID=UPI00342C4586